jgi:hypothetical protein
MQICKNCIQMTINEQENFGYSTIMYKSQVNRTEPNGFAELNQV